MANPVPDSPEIRVVLTEMRQYASYKSRRDRIILDGLLVRMQPWRIAMEMGIDRKTVFKVKREHAEMIS